MRYIGGKSKLLDFIESTIAANTRGVRSVLDIFSGSGIVSSFLQSKGYDVISNDILYFSYIINRGSIGISELPSFKTLGIPDVLEYLNNLRAEDTTFPAEKFFITNNYSPTGDCKRMYFQPDNAVKIDIIRLTIEDWKTRGLLNDDEYFYLLASLINAVPFVSNITGVYAAYLKFWDVRTFNKLHLEAPAVGNPHQTIRCFNSDFREIAALPADILYADPPYNERDYFPNYHILETIARYDYPAIKGVTGLRPYTKSPFCSKKNVVQAFRDLIESSNSRYVLISYNNEALLSTEALSEICLNYAREGTFRLFEKDYRRYKNKIPNNKEGLREQLYLFEKN